MIECLRRRIMQHTIKAFIRKSDTCYVAECLEISVVTQGKTLDETIANLEEAVALHLEGEDPADFGLAPNPTLLVTLELQPFQRVA
jgi:predicted RNase H-like HicB family nuclease